ncbi:MAG: hypothetical protein WEA09_14685 [Gemmatimonadota bacterium]
MTLTGDSRRLPVAALVLLMAIWAGCTFEPRPNGEARADDSVGEGASGEEAELDASGAFQEPATVMDSVLWISRGFQEGMAHGDLSEALALLHRDVELVYGPPGSLGSTLSPGERLLQELLWRQEGERSFQVEERSITILEGSAVVKEILVMEEGSDPRATVTGVQILILVPGEGGWKIRWLHRTLDPSAP